MILMPGMALVAVLGTLCCPVWIMTKTSDSMFVAPVGLHADVRRVRVTVVDRLSRLGTVAWP